MRPSWPLACGFGNIEVRVLSCSFASHSARFPDHAHRLSLAVGCLPPGMGLPKWVRIHRMDRLRHFALRVPQVKDWKKAAEDFASEARKRNIRISAIGAHYGNALDPSQTELPGPPISALSTLPSTSASAPSRVSRAPSSSSKPRAGVAIPSTSLRNLPSAIPRVLGTAGLTNRWCRSFERRDRVDDFICGHNGTGVVRDIDVESGVHSSPSNPRSRL